MKKLMLLLLTATLYASQSTPVQIPTAKELGDGVILWIHQDGRMILTLPPDTDERKFINKACSITPCSVSYIGKMWSLKPLKNDN